MSGRYKNKQIRRKRETGKEAKKGNKCIRKIIKKERNRKFTLTLLLEHSN